MKQKIQIKGWVLYNPNMKKTEFMTVDMRPHGYTELGQVDMEVEVELRDLDNIDHEIAHLESLINVAKTQAQTTETQLLRKIDLLNKTKGELNASNEQSHP